jgi:hypothetical protein
MAALVVLVLLALVGTSGASSIPAVDDRVRWQGRTIRNDNGTVTYACELCDSASRHSDPGGASQPVATTSAHGGCE